MPELIVKLDDTTLQTCKFDGELLCIGRSRENDIVLDNLSVSRHHGQIRFHDGRYVITDLNSSNGIMVNGVRVTKTEVVDEDVITIGKHTLIFSNAAHDEAPPAGTAQRKNRPARETRTGARFEVASGRLQGREFKITRFETSLGKAPTNDIVLSDDWLLAKKQAILLRRGNGDYEIQDLGGLRRVKINGTAISERVDLRDGDTVELGGTKLIFHSTDHKPKHAGAFAPDLTTPAKQNALNVSGKLPAVKSEAAVPDNKIPADNDGFDLEESFESLEMALLKSRASELADIDDGSGDDEDAVSPDSALGPTDSVFNGSKNSKQRMRKQARPEPEQRDSEPHNINLSNDDQDNISVPENVDDKEVKMWEAALESPSPAIRRQAARTLKKLTGRDYEV